VHNNIERNLPELGISMLDKEEWWAFKGEYAPCAGLVLYSLVMMAMEDH